jgi:hypothetical protein
VRVNNFMPQHFAAAQIRSQARLPARRQGGAIGERQGKRNLIADKTHQALAWLRVHDQSMHPANNAIPSGLSCPVRERLVSHPGESNELAGMEKKFFGNDRSHFVRNGSRQKWFSAARSFRRRPQVLPRRGKSVTEAAQSRTHEQPKRA